MQRGNDLQQKRVVVVGGSSGIGLAVAQQAASQGAQVVIVSSNAERIQKAVECIGAEAQGQAVDVSDEGAVATFFSKFGSFDHLVFPPAIACICATLLPRISNRPDAPLSCAIGPHSPQSSTEAHKSARGVLSCSQPGSPASARKKDG